MAVTSETESHSSAPAPRPQYLRGEGGGGRSSFFAVAIGGGVLFIAMLVLAAVGSGNRAEDNGGLSQSERNSIDGFFSPEEPVQIGEADLVVNLTPGSPDFVVPEILSEQPITGSLVHLATGSGPFDTMELFSFDQVGTLDGYDEATLQHCVSAYKRSAEFGSAAGGSICTPDSFTSTENLYSLDGDGIFDLAVFFAVNGSELLRVETDSGYVIESNIENGVGYVQWDETNGRALWLSLFDQSGTAIWSMRMS